MTLHHLLLISLLAASARADSVVVFNEIHYHPDTAEASRDVSVGQRTMVITQHGEAKAVLQGIVSYEQTQESLALLKMLAQSSKGIQAGRSKPVKKAFADIRKHIN